MLHFTLLSKSEQRHTTRTLEIVVISIRLDLWYTKATFEHKSTTFYFVFKGGGLVSIKIPYNRKLTT